MQRPASDQVQAQKAAPKPPWRQSRTDWAADALVRAGEMNIIAMA
jgi:hypothetical protein